MKNHFYILLPMLILLIKSTAIGQVQQYPSGPLYEEGVIYLKLKDTFAEQISYPPNGGSVSSSLDSLYSTFQENGVTTYAKPFAIFATTQFDRIYKIYFGNSSTSLEFIDELRLLSIVDYAEQVPLKTIFQTVPNDPSIPNNSNHLQLINAFNAFDIHTGGNSIVAIVDDAVLTTHEDLAANIVAGWDAADLDNDPNPPSSASTTYFSHGTHVAGIAAGATNNNIGIASIGWNTKIMPVKTVSDNGNPQFITFGFEGVAWAATHGVDVINMSWGGSAYSQSEYLVIEMARQMNIILIAAAGNDSNTSPKYPAAYGEGTTGEIWEQNDPLMVIAVASLDASSSISSFSNFGTWVDVSAYGTNIYSTVADGRISKCRYALS